MGERQSNINVTICIVTNCSKNCETGLTMSGMKDQATKSCC